MQKGLLTPLSEMFANPALVDPRLRHRRHHARLSGERRQGRWTAGIPRRPDRRSLRHALLRPDDPDGLSKDLLDKHGIKVPETYDELAAASRTLKEKEGIGGLTGRAQSGHHATDFFLTPLRPDRRPHPRRQLRAGPERPRRGQDHRASEGVPGDRSGGHDRLLLRRDDQLLRPGAMPPSIWTPSKVRKTAENPKKSKVVGKVGYALHPTIDGKCGSGTGGFCAGDPRQREEQGSGLPVPSSG